MDWITHQSPRQRGYGSTSSLRNDSLKHTRKHERKNWGIEPRNKSCQVLADCPARSRGPSAKANRTTRNKQRKTDRPRRSGGPFAWDPDRPLLKLGPSANQLQRKPKTKPDRKRRWARTWRTCDELGAREPSARHARTVCASRTEASKVRPRRSTPPTHHRISQTVEAVETRVWGHYMRQPTMLYPKDFAS
jgi:hypothetical protein